jgi:integrase
VSRERWEARAEDVPGGRITRSLKQGLAGLSEADRAEVVDKRKAALDRLRGAANAVRDEKTTAKIWDLVADIGKDGDHPSWDEVVAATTTQDFINLAMRSERQRVGDGETGTVSSELRTVRQSIDDYLDFKEKFGANTYKNSASVLKRAVAAPDPKNPDDDDRTFGERRVAGVTRTDAYAVVPSLSTIENPKKTTLDDYRKHLHAWFAWELTKEEERAEDQNRQPIFTANPFVDPDDRYSSPNTDRHMSVAEEEGGRRFTPEEAEAILEAADVRTRLAFLICYKLGLRPGELIHLRWMKDVRPLKEGDGYRVEIQGGESRAEETRCGCRSCSSPKGWAPKTGLRTYHLDRNHDRIGWITDLCDALDRWVAMLDPSPGGFLVPSPSDNRSTWTNQDLNRKLHDIADDLRESGRFPDLETGIRSERQLTMHSWRHSCASMMLDLGVPAPLAAEWIGDRLETFRDVYAKPDSENVARVTLAGYGRRRRSE